MNVALVIPTRGDVDLGPVLAPFRRFTEIAVWNNAVEEDLGVYGRYAAIDRTTAPVIITVDDDAALPTSTLKQLLRAYRPGEIVCNVPRKFRKRYTDSGLVGFGAIFDRDLPAAAFERFAREADAFEQAWFRRTCDIVFTMLTPLVHVDLPYTNMPYASDENRMWRQRDHFDERERMRELCRHLIANGSCPSPS